MPHKRTIACLHFSDKDKTLLQSLLSGIGLHQSIHWHFTDGTDADVVLIEWDTALIRLTPLRSRFPRSLFVAYSAHGDNMGDVSAILRKPLRARELQRLLTGLETSLNGDSNSAAEMSGIPVLLNLNGSD